MKVDNFRRRRDCKEEKISPDVDGKAAIRRTQAGTRCEETKRRDANV